MVKPKPTSQSEPGLKGIFYDKHKKCQIPEPSEYGLGNVADPTVYSVDCLFKGLPGKHGKRCDEFVFFILSHNKTGLYLIERKDTESPNVTEAKEQLQGGANFIQDFLNDDPSTENQSFDFMPVLVSDGIRHRLRSRLRTTKISISLKGKSEEKSALIEHCKTGERLPPII